MAGDPASRIGWELNKLFFPVRTGVTHPVLAMYYRGLAQCVEAGISLQQALASLETQTGMKPALVQVTQGIRDSLSRGETLGQAAEAHPYVFSPLAVGLIEVGESIGALAENLKAIATMHEARHRMIQAIIRRMMYPVILVLFAAYVPPIAIVIPRGIGGYVEHVAPRTLLIGFILVVAVFGPPILRGLLGRNLLDGLVLAVPMYGTAERHMVVARFCRALGTAVAAGVEMGQSYTLAVRAMDNVVLEGKATKALTGVKQSGLARGLTSSGLFSPSQIGIIEIGEQTGHIGDNMVRMAGDLEQSAETVLGNFGRLVGGGLFIIVVVLSLMSVFTTMLGIGQNVMENTPKSDTTLFEKIGNLIRGDR